MDFNFPWGRVRLPVPWKTRPMYICASFQCLVLTIHRNGWSALVKKKNAFIFFDRLFLRHRSHQSGHTVSLSFPLGPLSLLDLGSFPISLSLSLYSEIHPHLYLSLGKSHLILHDEGSVRISVIMVVQE
eukprot:TRINITY_DN12264_c0_g2_i3.p1 TRINITY_DN12264_c0_g2~~TRINITY_DN12264_c0_g2_i3.p1  ORF type:complete len:129 (-),score=18.45 TRINITY_DN12264_c0_g2_i3:905-1291(-)